MFDGKPSKTANYKVYTDGKLIFDRIVTCLVMLPQKVVIMPIYGNQNKEMIID